jgi:ferric-dicitrate binding protein FerR (iron transport regulator)
MEPAALQILLEKYFSGNATVAESRQAVDWLAAQEGQSAELGMLMDQVWRMGGERVLSLPDSQRLLQSVLTGAATETALPPVVVMPPRRRMTRQWAVAIMLLLLGSMMGWYALRQYKASGDTMQAMNWQELRNTGTHVKRAQLADGSVVWLMPQSTLRYPGVVAEKNRLLQLEGEAYFEIAADAARPLSVIAGGVVTCVLGTAFHLEAYANEPIVNVSLTQGKVSVTPEQAMKVAGEQQYLLPGQAYAWNRQRHTGTIHAIDTTTVMSCRKGYFVFHELSLSDALYRVSARFGCTIRVDPALVSVLHEKKVTGVFGEENAEEMIRNLLFVYGYHYKITGKSVTILP